MRKASGEIKGCQRKSGTFGRQEINRAEGGAGGGIRTHERLCDKVLSLAPLTRLGNPRPHHVEDKPKINISKKPSLTKSFKLFHGLTIIKASVA